MTQNQIQDATPVWRIDSPAVTCVVRLDREMPRLVYWGSSLAASEDLHALCEARRKPPVDGALDIPEALTLLPETGTGFSALPGIQVHRDGRDFLTQLAMTSVDAEPDRLRFDCEDALSKVAVSLVLALDVDSNVLTVNNTISNTGTTALDVDWFASAVLPLPSEHSETIAITGRWANEFQLNREQLGVSSLVRENRSGRTSHASFPGLLTGTSGFDPTSGDCAALHLAWSGNHRIWLGRARDHSPFVQLGVLLQSGELRIEPGEQWSAPAVHAATSEQGYNASMQAMHRHVRKHVLRAQSRKRPRPIHFNTWEACYFDHSEARTLALVAEAARLGAERFILDDGWFSGRNDDKAGLGNWSVSSQKYPRGLEPVFAAIRNAGMQTGLWIEPEMANLDSDTLREHPDWILGDSRRVQPLGRFQYALNICREDVADYLVRNISALITRYELDYIKWDMNRDLTHAIVDERPGNLQMVDAAYRLIATVRNRHPNTEIEICSSGGARADFAMLALGDRIWTSDNHDPRDRQRIQHGFSLFFPPEVMGTHIGSEVSDITGRTQSLEFRIATALIGHFGIEPNRDGLSSADITAIRKASGWYRGNRSWLQQSTSAFLPHTNPNILARSQVAPDGKQAVIVVALLGGDTQTDSQLRCVGLAPETTYAVFQLDCLSFRRRLLTTLDGATLCEAGFTIPAIAPDAAHFLELEAADL